MAFLEYQTAMTGWWEIAHLNGLANGDEIVSMTSQAAGLYQFTTATGPTYTEDGPNGLPFARFDGASQFFSGPVIWSNLVGAELGTIVMVARPTAIVNNSGTITANDPLLHGAITNTPGLFLRNNAGAYTFYVYNYSGVAQSASVVIPAADALGWAIYVWRTSAANIFAHRNDAYVPGQGANAAGINRGQAVQMGMNGAGTTWFTGDVAALLSYSANLAVADLGKVLAYLMARYFSPNDATLASPIIRGDAFEQIRDRNTRQLLEREQRQQDIDWRGGAWLQDYQIGDDLALAHGEGLDPLGAGGGWSPDDPKDHRVIGISQDSPASVTLKLRPL